MPAALIFGTAGSSTPVVYVPPIELNESAILQEDGYLVHTENSEALLQE